MDVHVGSPCSARNMIADHLHSSGTDAELICLGDEIEAADETTLRGHGTRVEEGRLVASVCGVVQKVSKLVTVKPLRSRYSAEVGDVVVGRIMEATGKRWHVDLQSRQEAQLLLSAITLPGGVQRRRTAEDELSMRDILQEGDLISAEVQALNHDGSVMLHARSSKYGRLVGGQLVRVAPDLIKRQKLHFQHLEAAGTDVILGCNGLVWVAPHRDTPSLADVAQRPVQEMMANEQPSKPLTPPTSEQRELVAAVAQAVAVLASLGLSVHGASILGIFALAQQNACPARAMQASSFISLVAAMEAANRQAPMQQD